MPMFLKKPVRREAVKFTGFHQLPFPTGLHIEDVSDDPARPSHRFYVITTQGQRVYVQPGEYVVKEPDGNGYYPCEATIFEREHDPVVESTGSDPGDDPDYVGA